MDEKTQQLHCDIEKPNNSLDLNGFCSATMKLQIVIMKKKIISSNAYVLGLCFLIEVGALLMLDKNIFEKGFMDLKFLQKITLILDQWFSTRALLTSREAETLRGRYEGHYIQKV